ncbi:OmpA family protein [Sphingomonas sp. TREG-RG-20F-R18-01]|uniref:OmpA family protein n=1 Tax=Sphingomonas sp. TREG-RG-20F-R18-01 TaxID=2914982 RepID=UPI001F58E483|nr:OmpA family protein [Sphingomonas sp. TREG-RG-20F-R18-01]
MPDPNDARPGAPRHVHIEKNQQPGWLKALAWLLLALGLLALIFALNRCHSDKTAAVAPAPSPTAVIGATPNAAKSAALVGTSGLGTYLAGSEATPRTFIFEKLNFDTAKSDIRAADAAEVAQVAAALKQYGTAHVRVAGYADSRGSDTANMALGKARAESVKSALVSKGIDASRIDTVSGGATDPVDTNATAGGRFENRRTELVVTDR